MTEPTVMADDLRRLSMSWHPPVVARRARVLAAALGLLVLGCVLLGAGTAEATPRETAERVHLEKLNATRAEAGLSALVAHAGLGEVARDWTHVMATQQRLYHNPALADLFSPRWTGLAENVAYRTDASATPHELAAQLHERFMASDGHRANILGDWHHVGVGVELSDDGTMWVTVVFARAAVPPLPDDVRDLAAGACLGGGLLGDGLLSGGFLDIVGNVHHEAITCLASFGVTTGTGDGTTYSPGDVVTRAQMAGFLARVIDEADGRALADHDGASRFADVGSSHTFASHVNRLAAAGIAKGGASGRPADYFAPQAPVSRAQMAAFLDRTYAYVTGGRLAPAGTCFPDVAGHPLQGHVDRLCVAGVVQGTPSGAYVPGAPVRRDAMASFVTRLMDVLVSEGAASPPA